MKNTMHPMLNIYPEKSENMFFANKTGAHNINPDYCFLMVIFITGLVLRLFWIDHPPHLDELWHFDISYKNNLTDAIAESRSVAHPPLYFIILWFWIPPGHSLEWLRLLSILSGATGPLFTYGIIKKLGFTRTGAFAVAIITSTLPAFVHISVMLRGYSLCHLFLWINLYYFLSVFSDKTGKISTWIFTASGFFALLSIHAAMFQVTASSLFFFLMYFKQRKKQNEKTRKILFEIFPHFLILASPVVLLLLQYRSSFLDHASDFLYSGSLSEYEKLGSFLIAQTGSYFKSLYKTPGSFEKTFMFILVFTGWCIAFMRKEKMLIIYSLVLSASISFQILASVSGRFPLGGSFRHDSLTYPSVILLLSGGILCLVKKYSSNQKSGIVASILLLSTHYYFTDSFFHKHQSWNLDYITQTLKKDSEIPVLVNRNGRKIMNFINYTSAPETTKQGYQILDIGKLNSCVNESKKCFVLMGGFTKFESDVKNLFDKHKNVDHYILHDPGFLGGKAKMFAVTKSLSLTFQYLLLPETIIAKQFYEVRSEQISDS